MIAPAKKVTPAPVAKTLLFADLVPNGSGGFTVVPRKPTAEIESREVARMLKVARSTLSTILNTAKGQKHLRWRWLTDKQGKRVFEAASVADYTSTRAKIPSSAGESQGRGPCTLTGSLVAAVLQ